MVGVKSVQDQEAGQRKVLRMLEALRGIEAGEVILGQVEHLLSDAAHRQQAIEAACIGLATSLLDAYALTLPAGSSERVRLQLLRTRLEPPFSATELDAISQAATEYAGRVDSEAPYETIDFAAAVRPLLMAFGLAGDAVPSPEEPAKQVHEPEPEPAPVELPDESWSSGALVDDPRIMLSDPALSAQSSEEFGAGDQTERRVDSVYRSHLDAKRRDIQNLQTTLAKQVLETIAQNEEFGVLLEIVLGELQQSAEMQDLEDLRWTLIREVEKLNKGHHELAEKLDSTHHYLQLIESDSRQLSDELTRVRLLSLTDELTGLPNRRAFLRRLEDEVARVQRYGFPLSLALIDLDHFKQINDQYGHAAGDEVLTTYSKQILSIFRHHDLVARYGGEEFAVLLPNTDSEGSQRALNKVKRRAQETQCRLGEEPTPVPTFSAGVSLYKPGETVGAFIERADKALYRAKRLGRNRVELDTTYRLEQPSGKKQQEPEVEDSADGGR